MYLRRKLVAVLFIATLLTSCFFAEKTIAADKSASVVKGNVRFQALGRVILAAQQAGVPKVGFITEPRHGEN